MLALTRRIGEEVVIGDPRNPLGVIRIMEIHGDKVRLSFDFPKDTQINRRELAEQKARQLNGQSDQPAGDQPTNDKSADPASAKSAAKDPKANPSDGYANPNQQPDKKQR